MLKHPTLPTSKRNFIASHKEAEPTPWLDRWHQLERILQSLPYDLIALIGRIGIAGIFWRSGQTKIEGLRLDLVEGEWALAWPRLSASAVDLFRDEYRLPLLPHETAAIFASFAEHLLPALLLLGLATRLSALGLLVMTAVIQVAVYPGAWPTHFTWAAVLMMLIANGPGRVSADELLRRWVMSR